MAAPEVTTPAETRRSARRRKTLLVQLALVAVILVAVWVSFKGAVLDKVPASPVPQHLGEMKLTGFVDGPEALAEIDKLHGGGINVVSGYMAHYFGGNDGMTVWVGRTETEAAAEDLARRMAVAIGRGRTEFTNSGTVSVDGHQVFKVDGPGGKSYFYASHEPNNRVVWLSIESSNADAILKQAVKVF